MKILSNTDHMAAVDIDSTLVETLTPKEYQNYVGAKFKVENPYQPGTYYLRRKRHGNLGLLKDLKGRGFTILVWSHGGLEYAAAVVKALGLESYVDYVSAKPSKFIDDRLDVEGIVGTRAFIEE